MSFVENHLVALLYTCILEENFEMFMVGLVYILKEDVTFSQLLSCWPKIHVLHIDNDQ
jgi:hypothetical protein